MNINAVVFNLVLHAILPHCVPIMDTCSVEAQVRDLHYNSSNLYSNNII